VSVSLDLKTSAENCGIVQLSAKIVRLLSSTKRKGRRQGTLCAMFSGRGLSMRNIVILKGGVTKYVNPGEDAEWSRATFEITGLSRTDLRITSAWEIGHVWSSLCSWINTTVAEDEHGIIIAYNGESSDMRGIWCFTQVLDAAHIMPLRLGYYMYPYQMIKKWKPCALNFDSQYQKTLAFNLKFQSLFLSTV
jgi:hypothetical protein